MRTKICHLLIFILLPGILSAEEAKVTAMSGGVEVRQTREGQWIPASVGIQVPEGGAIRTNSGAEAEMLMPNKTKVWLKENSDLELEQRQTFASRLALVFGNIKLRVPHLLRQERFEVRTPAAVCAVRGTEFTLGTTEEGRMRLQVLFGEVKLRFTIPPERGSDKFEIPQGQELRLAEVGKGTKPELMTAAEENEALEDWAPGLKPEERLRAMKQKASDRAQLKQFAMAANSTDAQVKSFLNVVKESDLEAGRTLTDVHGNLVRVDQRMMRPAPDEVQFFNLVKRPVYSDNNDTTANSAGFVYNGAQGVTNRLDYMQMTMAFNKDLPQSISDWPSFFNANSVKPAWASFVLANRTDPYEIFFIAEGYVYDPNTDALLNDTHVVDPNGKSGYLDQNVVITGVLNNDSSGITALQGLNKISNLQIEDSGNGHGTLYYTDAGPTSATRNILKDASNNPILVGGDASAPGTGRVVWAVQVPNASYEAKGSDSVSGSAAGLWQDQADMYNVGNDGSTYFWFAKENYIINNGGGIKTVGDFTNSTSDPFSILKNSALETVMYIKKSNLSEGSSGLTSADQITTSALARADIMSGDYFSYSHSPNYTVPGYGANIDVVFIPDLMTAAVQNMLPAINNLKN
jgi:hypothetical protein